MEKYPFRIPAGPGSVGSEHLDPMSSPHELFEYTAAGDDTPVVTVEEGRTFEADKFAGFGIVPIGTILPWHKSLTGTPSLPDGWAECNGQTINDSDSVYDGQTLPDLNGDKRFLRGGSTSGTEQSWAIENITGSFTNRRGSTSALVTGGSGALDRATTSDSATMTSNAATQPAEYITFDASRVVQTSTETRPINMSVVFIIRIK